MSDIPEHLLRRSAEAKAKALGITVEEALAALKGEAPLPDPSATEPQAVPVAAPEETPAEVPVEPEAPVPAAAPAPAAEVAAASTDGPPPASGGGLATVVRPTEPPAGGPGGVRTQRLLTVVKAQAIQQVKAEPTDKVSTWPHLMIAEFAALLALTGVLIIMSVSLQAPLLEGANFNVTPNPSKAPWYFLGLQELLSYFDPAIAGVSVPLITGFAGLMAVPYIDKNPSNKPSDRKFAIMMFTFFLAGSATLTIIGVLFRGPGFNFTYPWRDGIFFDDLADWIPIDH
jgi:menaquinol-cytochrome c reductase cytochrome b/c subunit